jgi:hypothetical protein
MKHLLLIALFAALLTTTAQAEETTAQAEEEVTNQAEDIAERPRHHEGLPARTLSQAVYNLSFSNDHLAALLAKRELSDRDLEIIHQLTYTLEIALAKLGEEIDAMATLVEEVHQGSENQDHERVRENGRAYLEAVHLLVR